MPQADTQSLEDSINGAINSESDVNTETPAVSEVTTEEQPQEVKSEVAVEKGDELKSEVEETFTNLDPKTIPDELKPFYKSMQADYTRKRQLESSAVKKFESENVSLKTQLEQLQETIERLKNGESVEDTSGQPKILTAEDVERIFAEKQDKVWEESAVSDLPTIDPRLDENNPIEYDENLDLILRTGLDKALEAHVEQTGHKAGFDFKNAAKEIINNYDKKLESYAKSWVSKTTKESKEKADNLRKSAPSFSPVTGKKSTGSLSLEDSIKVAMGQG